MYLQNTYSYLPYSAREYTIRGVIHFTKNTQRTQTIRVILQTAPPKHHTSFFKISLRILYITKISQCSPTSSILCSGIPLRTIHFMILTIPPFLRHFVSLLSFDPPLSVSTAKKWNRRVQKIQIPSWKEVEEVVRSKGVSDEVLFSFEVFGFKVLFH